MANSEESLSARVSDVQRAEVDRRQTMATLSRNEALGLKCGRASRGVLQEVPVDVGQRIGPERIWRASLIPRGFGPASDC